MSCHKGFEVKPFTEEVGPSPREQGVPSENVSHDQVGVPCYRLDTLFTF